MEVSSNMSDIVLSNVADIDMLHGWVNSSKIHNILMSRKYNVIRFFEDLRPFEAKFKALFKDKLSIKYWEDKSLSK